MPIAAQVAGDSGELPNLGPNDGALLLPLSTRPFSDFRPTIQAAGKLFQGMDYFPPGPWDDLSHWLGITVEDATRVSPAQNLPEDLRQTGLYINRYDGQKTILRGISFINRPGHSDQLHLDIWYEGVNVARDPGTYLYNGLPPWDNPLTGAWCHNTIMLDGREPMLKGGRFLWLNWSDATVRRHRRSADRAIDVLFASHQARQWAGLTQQRSVVIIRDDMVIVVDEVLGEGEHQVLLNWNLADLPWGIKGSTIALEHQQFKASLTWPAEAGAWGLFRAGARLAGEAAVKDPELYGWDARTYARKEPGLQLVVQLQGALPLRMLSTWGFNAPDMNQLAVDWQDVRKDELPFSGVRWGELGWEA